MLACVLFALAATASPAAAADAADPVSSSELVERSAFWDGKRVSLTGEAIGGAMRRGGITWLHVNDDAYAYSTGSPPASLEGYNSGQAVVAPSDLASRVALFGTYRRRGDLLRVEGIFRAADSRYGGDMVIDADVIEIVREGEILSDKVAGWKLLALAMLTASALAALLMLKREQRRRILA